MPRSRPLRGIAAIMSLVRSEALAAALPQPPPAVRHYRQAGKPDLHCIDLHPDRLGVVGALGVDLGLDR